MSELSPRGRLRLLLRLLAPERRMRIADVGARAINDNPYLSLLRAGAAEVWGFEPAEDAYQELCANASELEHYLPYAVGDGTPGQFNICRGTGFSSLLEPDLATLGYLGRWQRLMTVVDRVPVETRRLDDIEDLPRIDLLKIDIQGGELAVFRHGRDRLSEAVAVITEVAFLPLYKDQPTLADQMAELAGHGFVLHKFLHQSARILLSRPARRLASHQHRNQLIDGDAVFVRDPRRLAELGDEQLKHLAIAADAVFQSYDLALFAVAALVERGAVPARVMRRYAPGLPFQLNPAPAEEASP
ncbi:MAG: FkbM family methyltransferase [Rhodobacteraceae bacterium]|nr:FkbM family methyltransferase [Paracoccaceae bacterium]